MLKCKLISRFFIPLSFFMLPFVGFTQDYQWWNELVDWNGHTPWFQYLVPSTSFLGPNALPVPEFHETSINNQFRIDMDFRYHHNPGDNTFDISLSAEYAFKDRIAFRVWMVPVEYYKMDVKTRNERKIRQFDPVGFSNGDLYFGTYIQLLKPEKNPIEAIFSANVKTASGNRLEAGRVTETPGYYFDLLLAKTIEYSNNLTIKPYVVGGLFVYQMLTFDQFQNDAFLYGIGARFEGFSQAIKCEWAGYNGYLDIGDKPSVLRINYEFHIKNSWVLTSNLQFGLRDLPYNHFSLGFRYIYEF